MSDVFEEVEESLRQDKASELWRKYGWIVIGAAALIVLATLVVNLMSYFGEQSRDQRVRDFEAARSALAEREYSAAIDGFEALATSGTEIAPLAASYLAQARIEGTGDVDGAVAALQIAADQGDEVIGDVSLIKLAYLRADALSLAELEALLEPLMKRDNSLEAVALEIIAAKAYAEGDFARARSEYGFLRISPNAPAGVKLRAENALAVIPRETVSDTNNEVDAPTESELPTGPEPTPSADGDSSEETQP